MKSQRFIEYLIGFIAAYAKEVGVCLSKTQLIKFLYLADLFYAREHRQTLTGWPWRYWHYGPYCEEAAGAIDIAQQKGIILTQTGPENEIFIEGTKYPVGVYEQHIPIEILHSLKSHIKRLAGDLTALLSYVYSETEPMIEAEYGDLLDFSYAQKLPPIPRIHIPKMPKDKKEKCISLIKKIAEKREKYLRRHKSYSCLSSEEIAIIEKAHQMWETEL